MACVYDFTDYRQYLKAYYAEKKQSNSHYSYQLLSERAGFGNRGFIFNVINGKKKLSKIHCFKLSQALRHSKAEAFYFENIVAYTQAKQEEARRFFYEQALLSNKGAVSPAQVLRKDHYEYYSKWYHSAIRALIDLYSFTGDYVWLSRKVVPAISDSQARRSVELLERLGLIVRDSEGRYRVTEKNIVAGSDISQLAKNRFNVEYTELAKKSITDLPTDKRMVCSLTLGVSYSTYRRICEEAVRFQELVVGLANADFLADNVYQCQMILFPLSTIEEPSSGS